MTLSSLWQFFWSLVSAPPYQPATGVRRMVVPAHPRRMVAL